MKEIATFLKLTWTERRLLATAYSVLLLTRFGLWTMSFASLQKRLKKLESLLRWLHQKTQLSPQQIVRAVNVSTAYMPGGAKCLARALTTMTLLESVGYSPELKFGVKKSTDSLIEAHAWVEYEGVVIIGGLNDLAQFSHLS